MPARAIKFAGLVFAVCLLTRLTVLQAGEVVAKDAGAAVVAMKVGWEHFLQKQDLVWERLPTNWNDGAFLGNGQLGDMVYADFKQNGLIIHLGREDVTDHRNEPKDLPANLKGKRPDNQVWGSGHTETYRIDIGDLVLHPAGKILSGTMRLDLWNAEARGTLVTSLGRIEWTAQVHANEMLTLCEVVSTEKTADGQPAAWRWDFIPSSPNSGRWLLNPKDKMFAKGFVPNPPPVMGSDADVLTCTETLLAGGDYATAWKEVNITNNHGLLLATIANEVPATGSAKKAAAVIRQGEAQGLDTLLAAHRQWWHSYWPESFVSLPDAKLESYYWIQMYKLGCITRADRALIDNTGPFFKVNGWPYATWDLNVQLCYKSMEDANHGELGLSLARYMRECGAYRIEGSRKNPRKLGDWLWVCCDLWNHYRHSPDETYLRDTVYPLLHQCMDIGLKALIPGADGKFHLPPMQSPEYSPTGVDFPDNNYDLALIRWGCQNLIVVATILKIEDPLVPRCREALAKLIDPPLDKDGTLMIAKDVPYAYSHRHYSHLIGIYPLHLYNWENVAERAMIEQSVRRWFETDHGGHLAGYSFTGCASMLAAMGKGDEAVKVLTSFIDGVKNRYILGANTLYFEGGGQAEVMETPLSAAQTIHEMLLQSWGEKIRVFPAVPGTWDEVAFHDLRAEGAFSVSAVRKNGQTQFIRIKSLGGEPCRVKTDMIQPVTIVIGGKTSTQSAADGVFQLPLAKGEEAVFYPSGIRPALVIEPVAAQGDSNHFGLKTETQP